LLKSYDINFSTMISACAVLSAYRHHIADELTSRLLLQERYIYMLQSVPKILRDLSLPHPRRMSKRVAVITGGAQGIGEAIALQLARDGLDIAIIDIRAKEDQMKAIVEKITTESDRRAIWMIGDVADETSVKECVESVVNKLGSLDVVSTLPEVQIFRDSFTVWLMNELYIDGC
jgi:FlaA1/EpsC-like NDP-sugar epimerase